MEAVRLPRSSRIFAVSAPTLGVCEPREVLVVMRKIIRNGRVEEVGLLADGRDGTPEVAYVTACCARS